MSRQLACDAHGIRVQLQVGVHLRKTKATECNPGQLSWTGSHLSTCSMWRQIAALGKARKPQDDDAHFYHKAFLFLSAAIHMSLAFNSIRQSETILALPACISRCHCLLLRDCCSLHLFNASLRSIFLFFLACWHDSPQSSWPYQPSAKGLTVIPFSSDVPYVGYD